MEASITINASVGECDATLETIRQWLQENARVTIPSQNLSGIIVQDDTPGADDRDKLWFKINGDNAFPYYWSTTCGKWRPMNGAPGDHITRHRINDTVAEDIAQWFGSGWELADGTNTLGVDLVNPKTKSVYAIHF